MRSMGFHWEGRKKKRNGKRGAPERRSTSLAGCGQEMSSSTDAAARKMQNAPTLVRAYGGSHKVFGGTLQEATVQSRKRGGATNRCEERGNGAKTSGLVFALWRKPQGWFLPYGENLRGSFYPIAKTSVIVLALFSANGAETIALVFAIFSCGKNHLM